MMGSIDIAIIITVFLCFACMVRAKSFRYEEIDISNEILREEIDTLPGYVIGIHKTDYMVEPNVIPDEAQLSGSCKIKDDVANRLIRGRFDSYHLNDSHVQIPLRASNRLIDVILYSGDIFGIPYFDCKDSTEFPKEYFNSFLAWKQLTARYSVTVENGGLKNRGEMVLNIGPLYMDVKTPKFSTSDFPKIEMSKVTEIKAVLKGLDDYLTLTIGSYLEEFKTAISSAAQRKMKYIVNHDVRNILLTYVRKSLSNTSEENMLSPFSRPLYSSLNSGK